MNSANAIELRNVSKSFKVQKDRAKTLKDLLVIRGRQKAERHEVLKNISLDIQKGETVALIGTNGSGKSTLLKLMTKIIYPNEGTVQTQGKLTSLLELGAGFHPDFTGRENIYFNAAIFGLTQKEIENRVDDIIEFSELGKAIDEPIRTYSSGMYMRLAFSIAINVDAEILLIDEILAVGDQHFQDKCFAKLRELKKSDKTIVIVSHSLEVVKDLCTRAIWIYRGEFKLDGDPTYVIDEYLKQLAIDNKEVKKAAVESGEESYKGAVFVDTPRNYSVVRVDGSEGHIGGWKLSDCEDATFSLKIGRKDITNIQKVERKDVFDIYQEEYSGYLKKEEIGFDALVKWSDYKDEVDEYGHLNIVASVKDAQGNVITDKEITVVVE